MFETLLCLQLLAAAPPAESEPRTVAVTITDDKGQALDSLGLGDVALLENGNAREVLSLRRDDRPLNLMLLVDTSEELRSSLRLNLVDALDAFLKALPEGTRFALWRTGERPTRVLDFGDDRGAAPAALRRLFPQGGNTMLDALVEATRELKQVEGQRRVVVAVSGQSIEFSSRPRQQVVEQARPHADTFYFLQIDEGNADNEMRAAYSHVFSELARLTGGLHETTLTSMATRKPLLQIAADLQNRYLLTYAGDAGTKPGKLELQVARPKTRLRLAQNQEPRR